MKKYSTFDVLGFIFGFSSGHAHDPIKRLFPVLKNALITLNVMPIRTISSVEELTQLVEKYGEIILDGVECSCVRSQNDEVKKAHYSGKKTAYSKNSRNFKQRPKSSIGVFNFGRKHP
jgi:hypothetical protein